jgi:hypothetical protein
MKEWGELTPVPSSDMNSVISLTFGPTPEPIVSSNTSNRGTHEAPVDCKAEVTTHETDQNEAWNIERLEERPRVQQQLVDSAKRLLQLVPSMATGDENGFLPLIHDNHNYNALQFAARMRCPELVGEILNVLKESPHMSDISIFDRAVRFADKKEGKTALVYAIEQIDLRSVEILLRYDNGLASVRTRLFNDNPLHSLLRILDSHNGLMPPLHGVDTIVRNLVKFDNTILDQECHDDANLYIGRVVVGGTPYQLIQNLGPPKNERVLAQYSSLQQTLRMLIYERGVQGTQDTQDIEDTEDAEGFENYRSDHSLGSLESALYGAKGKFNAGYCIVFTTTIHVCECRQHGH